MKKLILFGLISILLISNAYAITWVDNYYGIRWVGDPKVQEMKQLEKTNTCDEQELIPNKIAEMNEHKSFRNAMGVLGDGYHVLRFEQNQVYGMDTFTLNIRHNQLVYVKEGICVPEHKLIIIPFNTDTAQSEIDAAETALDKARLAFSYLKQIRGINILQKYQIVSAVLQLEDLG